MVSGGLSLGFWAQLLSLPNGLAPQGCPGQGCGCRGGFRPARGLWESWDFWDFCSPSYHSIASNPFLPIRTFASRTDEFGASWGIGAVKACGTVRGFQGIAVPAGRGRPHCRRRWHCDARGAREAPLGAAVAWAHGGRAHLSRPRRMGLGSRGS